MTVATYGSSQDFPGFFCPSSGIKVDCNLRTPLDCANLISIVVLLSDSFDYSLQT